jgi:hypothetical protein
MAAITGGEQASGSVCGRPGDAITLPPPLGVLAPRNVRPRVTLHASWRTDDFCPPWPVRQKPCAKGAYDLRLRVAGEDVVIPIDLRTSTSGDVATVEIVPKSALPARTRFEIVHVESSGISPTQVIGTFMTGDAIDQTPPSWLGVTSFQRFGTWPGIPLPPPAPRSAATRNVITLDELADCRGPGVSFSGGPPPTDDATRSEDLRIALWAGDPAQPIDYTAPPLAYLRGIPQRTSFDVTFGGDAHPSNFSFERGKLPIKYGLRAVDLAGNVSAPSEITVKRL